MRTADALDVVRSGVTVATAELPHRDVRRAVDFAFEAFELPTAPSLPGRSGGESGLAQALTGVAEVSAGADGALRAEPLPSVTAASIRADLARPAFTGLRAFLEHGRRRAHATPVRWTLPGPITAGVALVRAGMAPTTAFEFAGRAGRAHVVAIAEAVAVAMPQAPQLMVLDESRCPPLGAPDCPISAGEAVDLLSSVLAPVERTVAVGVRVGGNADLGLVLESGPRVLEVPATVDPATCAGHLTDFLARGGWITWGVVAAEAGIVDPPTRAWNRLTDLWCQLVRRGCELSALRGQAMFATADGLAAHTPAGAANIAATVADVARLVRGDTGAARLVLGG